MLNEAERTGLENILNLLEGSVIFNLCDTITERVRKPSNRNEAIKDILDNCEKPTDLLRRQKITKRILAQYLDKLNGRVPVNCTRIDLIGKCLEEWRSIDTCQNMECTDIEPIDSYENHSDKVINYAVDNIRMATEFSKWFFTIYNNLNDFGAKHFWPDVKLEVVTGGQMTIIGAENVVSFLSSLILRENLKFLPNESPSSLQCLEEIHGLVIINVNGVLYRFNNPFGIFETRFGLIRCVDEQYQTYWRIKWLNMNLKSNAITSYTC